MSERVRELRERARDFRRLAENPRNSESMKERLLQLAAQCDRLARDIARSLPGSQGGTDPQSSAPMG